MIISFLNQKGGVGKTTLSIRAVSDQVDSGNSDHSRLLYGQNDVALYAT
jgi:hypothetical protein